MIRPENYREATEESGVTPFPMAHRSSDRPPRVVLGEIRTCLLPHSAMLDSRATGELLTVVPGASVRHRERPGPLAFSPLRATGVDCSLPWGPSAEVRIVGTVTSTGIVVGGRTAQLSTHTVVVRSAQRRRAQWSHYLERIGTTEIIGVLPDSSAIDHEWITHYHATSGPTVLDLGSICAQNLDDLCRSPLLDRSPPLRCPTTRLRWTAWFGGSAGPAISFGLDDGEIRTANLVLRDPADIPAAVEFCRDLAAHDWLLTVLDEKMRTAAGFDVRDARRIDPLVPVLEQLAPMWMPGAHTPSALRALWRELQRDAGFSKQWSVRLQQLRDYIAVATYYR